MQNDPNTYGTPPASNSSIQKLKKEEVNEKNLKDYEKQECTICKDIFKLKEHAITMPCEHSFHEDCLLPWLKKHNSCPICRHELATDDKDYESRKKELRRTITNNSLRQQGINQRERRSNSNDNSRRATNNTNSNSTNNINTNLNTNNSRSLFHNNPNNGQ